MLGLGSTLGIAIQLARARPVPALAPASASRPRFDFVGTGLAHTFRLGVWTVLFVVVNQIAYSVVVRIASAGTKTGEGTGYTIYSNTFLVVMTPHAIITVSLATAVLTRLAAYVRDADLPGLAHQVSTTLRSALSLIVPFALVLPLIALPVSNLVSRYGAATSATHDFARTLATFGIALLFFTCHYIVLRGFYALERNRTVFWVQCVIGVGNIALAFTLTRGIDPEAVAPRLALAYGAAYAIGAGRVLRRAPPAAGWPGDPRTGPLRRANRASPGASRRSRRGGCGSASTRSPTPASPRHGPWSRSRSWPSSTCWCCCCAPEPCGSPS
ncbi:MAG: lipid II flippase MurJ [Propionicimonas sp.]|uniref:lipid II flippase MurJ n=1 Tax=Propionicimonas sp. TaxID=1955623 RepID=UPI003D0CFC8E